MRVLHLDRQRHWAGQQARTLSLALRQKAAGDEVVIACSPGSGYEERAPAAGIRTLVLRMRGRRLPVAMLRLSGFLRRERIDVVDAHGAVDHQLALFATHLAPRTTVVRTKHNHTHLRGFMSRFTYGRMTGRIVAVSEFVRANLLADGIAPEQVVTVADGIDTRAIADVAAGLSRAEARARLSIPEGAFAVGTTSRPAPRKGLDIAIRAIASVARERPDIPIHYVAAGGSPEDMRGMSKALGLDPARLIAPGLVRNVAEVFPALDAYVFPSLDEALGMALLEALAGGCAVAASEVGGIREVIVDGEHGLLVPPGDPDALAKAIVRLHDDPALARRLAAQGKARVIERYDIACMVEGTKRAYEAAIAPRRATAPRAIETRAT